MNRLMHFNNPWLVIFFLFCLMTAQHALGQSFEIDSVVPRPYSSQDTWVK